MLHRFAKLLAACTVLLILAGSLVTSHDAGLSVPDWPTSYGWNMFTFPPSMWVANIFYEHGHRLIASTVGFLTIILAVWLWMTDPRALAPLVRRRRARGVIVQGILGGITVLYLPAGRGVDGARGPRRNLLLHDGRDRAVHVAAMDRGLRHLREVPYEGAREVDDARLRRLATATTVLIYSQILVGATMRHTGAGLAIPDFPWMFGHVVPDHWNRAIAVHFAHRAGALVVTGAIVMASAYVWSRHRRRRELTRPAALLIALVAAQLTLGALTVLSQRNPWINSFHVVGGALVLTTSLVLALRSWRVRFADEIRNRRER